ncbi:DUF4270 domain-containing protein [Neptunitalea lumnitzerae]|nr:DUF4270 domain-containing protein [Neptunitalea sp. Y10]
MRALALGIMLLGILTSCEKDFSNLDLPGVSPNFDTDVAYFKTFAKNVKLNSVQTNGLTTYQLGKYTSDVYGEEESYIVSQLALPAANPSFGLYSQEREVADDTLYYTIDEEETVTRVYLDIPYFTSATVDEDGNPVLDGFDVQTYELDSIYGNQDLTFGLRVEKLDYYLGDYQEPDFTEAAKYFSSDPTPNFLNYTSDILGDDDTFEINDGTLITFDEDDPETEDVDESEDVAEVLLPRIRIDLDTQFFQEMIIDQEGSSSFSSNANFREYLRGIVISTYNLNENLLMLLDISQANITIEYTYTTATEDEDGVIEYDDTNESSFTLGLSGNVIQKTTTNGFPVLDTSEDAELVYLKGTEGSMAEITLFEPDDIQMMRDENWLINEANLTFYVDRTDLDGAANELIEPNRIYLFNKDEESTPLIDYLIDSNGSTTSGNVFYNRFVHGGIIEKNDDGDAIQYKIRLTEHLNNIVRHDSLNVTLGLVVLSDITNVATGAAKVNAGAEEIIIPNGSTTNPSGTILYGSSATVPEDRRLRLEVFYTKPSN